MKEMQSEIAWSYGGRTWRDSGSPPVSNGVVTGRGPPSEIKTPIEALIQLQFKKRTQST